MEHAVRRAAMPDRLAVEEIVREAYEPWVALIGARPEPMDADYAALIAEGRVHVAASGGVTQPGDVEGLIVLIPEAGALLVANVAVRPERRGQGIGRRLLAFAEEEARRLGLPAVRLYTHAKMIRNIALYEAIGYAETGREAIEGGSIVLMRKQLDNPP
jgi:GNAT superfamily N-acetyltransferase